MDRIFANLKGVFWYAQKPAIVSEKRHDVMAAQLSKQNSATMG